MKKLIILRGVPGSGKSTKARALVEEICKTSYLSVCIWSADNYFIRPDGVYDFNPFMLKNAHEWCRKGVQKSMTGIEDFVEPVNLIVVDNTNIKKEHYKRYLELAKEYGYETEEILVGETSPDYAGLYAARNQHGVTKEKILSMMENFEK